MTGRGSVLEGVSEQLMELLERQQAEIDALARAAEDRRSQLAAMLDRLQRDGSSESSMQTLEGLDEVRSWILEHAPTARHEAVTLRLTTYCHLRARQSPGNEADVYVHLRMRIEKREHLIEHGPSGVHHVKPQLRMTQ